MKGLVPFILFSVVCVLYSSFLLAQHSKSVIRGKVTNQKSDPIVGATISLEGSTYGAVSDVNGQFILETKQQGELSLLFSAVGFKKKRLIVTANPHHDNQLLVLLESDALQLSEVAVYGKSEGQQQREKGFAINAIETKGLELQSIQANDLLDRAAGVRIRQDGGLGSRVRYNLNGLSGSSVKIFLNGIPIESYGASFSITSIPSSMIDRIEVYKGVVPAHLADDALGGAINVVTKSNLPNSANLSYSAGSFNTHQVSIGGNYRDNVNGFTAQANAFYNYSDNNYKVSGDKVYVTDQNGKKEYVTAQRFHDAYSSTGVKVDVGFTDVSWADQFFVGGVMSTMEKEIQHGVTMEIVYGNRKSEQNTLLLHTVYSKEDLFLKGLNVDLFASYSTLERGVVDTIPYMYNWNGERIFDDRTQDFYKWSSGAEVGNPTLNVDLESKLSGRLGMNYTMNDNNSFYFNVLFLDFQRDTDDPLRPIAERELIDTRFLKKRVYAFSYENSSFNDKLKTSVFYKHYFQNVRLRDAVRSRSEGLTSLELDDDTRENGFGVALSFLLLPKFRILTSAENAVRLPNNREIFGNAAQNVLPAYGLRPERAKNLNAGFELGPFPFHRHRIKLNSNFFYRDITGMIRMGVPDQQDETAPHVNIDQIQSTGVDVELDYRYHKNWTWVNGLSLSNPRFNREFNEYGARFSYYQDRLRNEPYFTINSNLRYNKNHFIQENSNLSLYYNFSFVHEFFRNWESIGGANKDIIPSQHIHDLGLAYTFPDQRVTLSFDVRNLLNEQVFDNWALQKPGRAFFGKFNYKIN